MEEEHETRRAITHQQHRQGFFFKENFLIFIAIFNIFVHLYKHLIQLYLHYVIVR